MPRVLFPIIVTAILIFLDAYVFSGLKFLIRDLNPLTSRLCKIGYWIFSVLVIAGFWFVMLKYDGRSASFWDKVILCVVFISMLSKLGATLFLAMDDIIRLFQWVIQFFKGGENRTQGISRKDFLVKSAAVVAGAIGTGMTYGVVRGSHRYQVIRQKLQIPGLPESFEGMRILQISDVHSGSFWNKPAVEKGIEMIEKENADIVFFTGDLVNNESSEMDEYIDLFSRVKAPNGVFSILGNHDYGEYLPNFTPDKLDENIRKISDVHEKLGWNLLRNENVEIEKDGSRMAILGVENWSNKMHFSRYGDLAKAYKGVENSEVKLLLSHDPSHWRGEILKEYPDIHATFSGHTHGMQFGIETAGFKWSPVSLAYPEWAGLYTEGNQHLYVNRGFGYLGFPGRLGIWPEITVFELTSA